MKKLFLFLAIICFFGSAIAAPTITVLGDLNGDPDTTPYGYIQGGTDHNIVFSVSSADTNAGGFLVDANLSLSCLLGTGIQIFNDKNLSTGFVHDSNNLETAVTFSYLYSVPNYDFNSCLILDLNATTKKADFNILIDSTKPQTTWDGNAGWQSFDANIHLACTDNNSGCTTTYYRLDTNPTGTIAFGALTPYTVAILVSAEGQWAITFYGTDNAGNQETSNAYPVNINKNQVANTSGMMAFDLNNVSNVVNNSVKIAEGVTGGVAEQGGLMGMAIGLSLAIGMLIGAILTAFYIVPTMINKLKEAR